MNGIQSISAYQKTDSNISRADAKTNKAADTAGVRPGREENVKTGRSPQVDTKEWSPIDEAGPLVPRKSEYGYTIGNVQLSDKAKAYYDTLKSKFHNMEFIAVSKDMKEQVKQNAAAYGNSGKMVVLIDDEKLERMAEDESYRNKYEGIIAMASQKLTAAKNSLSSTGAKIKNFGMSVDSNGTERLFATVEKANDLQKKRLEKKAAEKKEQKIKEKKKAEKETKEERLEKTREKKAEAEELREDEEKEYVSIEADSLEELLTKLQDYSFSSAAGRIMTEAERSVGTHIDFRG